MNTGYRMDLERPLKKRPGSRRAFAFETVFKLLEVAGLISLGLIDVVISGAVWSLLINSNFYFMGITLTPSVIGGIIALAFWQGSFFVVRFIGKVLQQNQGGTFSQKMRNAFKDDRVKIGLVAAVVLMVADMIGDSFSAVMMVYPDADVFNIIGKLSLGPPMMFFMMFVVVILTTLGEPIIFYRLIWLGVEKEEVKPYPTPNLSGDYGGRRPPYEPPPPKPRRRTQSNFRPARKP